MCQKIVTENSTMVLVNAAAKISGIFSRSIQNLISKQLPALSQHRSLHLYSPSLKKKREEDDPCTFSNIDIPEGKRLFNKKSQEKKMKTKTCLMDIGGKVAMVTGGARGIGLETCQLLLFNGCRTLILTDCDEKEGKTAVKYFNKQFGQDKCIFIKLNIAEMEDWEYCFDCINEKFDQVDILVNNAGILSDNAWEYEVDVNVNGVIRGCLLGFMNMSSNKGGHGGVILNIASTKGLEPSTYYPMNCATKHAVVGLSRSLGDKFHYKRTDVRVIAICPGLTRTGQLDKIVEGSYIKKWGREAEELIATLPIEPPLNVAKAIVYAIRHTESGQVLFIEDCSLFQTEIPDRKSYSLKMFKFTMRGD